MTFCVPDFHLCVPAYLRFCDVKRQKTNDPHVDHYHILIQGHCFSSSPSRRTPPHAAAARPTHAAAAASSSSVVRSTPPLSPRSRSLHVASAVVRCTSPVARRRRRRCRPAGVVCCSPSPLRHSLAPPLAIPPLHCTAHSPIAQPSSIEAVA